PIGSESGAESRVYLPLAAIVVLAVIIARPLLRRSRVPATSAIAVAIVCVPFAVATVHRNGEYQSAVRLWQTVVARHPHARAHRNLALELRRPDSLTPPLPSGARSSSVNLTAGSSWAAITAMR